MTQITQEVRELLLEGASNSRRGSGEGAIEGASA